MAAAGPSGSGGAAGGAGAGILYALVARGAVVLCEHSSVAGNSSVVAVGLLPKVPQQEGFRASWAAGRHIFHILHAGGLTYLCMADEVGGWGLQMWRWVGQQCRLPRSARSAYGIAMALPPSPSATRAPPPPPLPASAVSGQAPALCVPG